MSKTIRDLPIGAKIKDAGTAYYGETIVWVLGDKNHPGYPGDSAALLSEKIIKIMAFDGAEPTSGNSEYKHFGNNEYALSNIRQWLNKAGFPWFSATAAGDAPPSGANVTCNPYDTENGFLSNFSGQFRNALMSTVLPMTDGSTVTDKVFLLSLAEAGQKGSDGVKWPVFSSDDSRIALITAGAASHSSFSVGANAAGNWFTRSKLASSLPYYARAAMHVTTIGGSQFVDPYEGKSGLRPGICVPLSLPVSDSPDGGGAYVIQWNRAPSKPPSITVPASVRIHKPVTVSWTAGADPDGDPVSYELQRSVNGAGFGNVYTGPNRTYTENAGADWNTVQHRVRTKDGKGAYSDYTTGPARTVIRNVDPTISGTDTSLGTVSAPPSYAYQVADADAGDTLAIVERLDGAAVRTIPNAARGTQYTCALSTEQYFSLSAGAHQISVTVTDSMGNSAARTVGFTRAAAAVDFDTKPRPADARPEQIMVNLRYEASDSGVTVQVCNNGFDASPAWEPAVPGKKHLFTNTAKTAGQWGVMARVRIVPSPEYPRVSCQSLSMAYL